MPRKQIRLPTDSYRGGNAFSVTIATHYRTPIFGDSDAAVAGVRCLRGASQRFDARVYAYCFMPDHVHLLAQTPPGTDLSRFVDYFKRSAGLALRDLLGTRDPIWQPRFYDHGLRSDEGLLSAAEYIFANPVKAGLVAEAGDYPFNGSFEWLHLFEDASEAKPTGLRANVGPPAITREPENTRLHAAEAKATGLHTGAGLL